MTTRKEYVVVHGACHGACCWEALAVKLAARGRRIAQVFWKPARTDHNVRNVAGRRARALAVHLDPAP